MVLGEVDLRREFHLCSFPPPLHLPWGIGRCASESRHLRCALKQGSPTPTLSDNTCGQAYFPSPLESRVNISQNIKLSRVLAHYLGHCHCQWQNDCCRWVKDPISMKSKTGWSYPRPKKVSNEPENGVWGESSQTYIWWMLRWGGGQKHQETFSSGTLLIYTHSQPLYLMPCLIVISSGWSMEWQIHISKIFYHLCAYSKCCFFSIWSAQKWQTDKLMKD